MDLINQTEVEESKYRGFKLITKPDQSTVAIMDALVYGPYPSRAAAQRAIDNLLLPELKHRPSEGLLADHPSPRLTKPSRFLTELKAAQTGKRQETSTVTWLKDRR